MGYDCRDSFPFDFEPNAIPFGSENGKENCHYDHIPFNAKGNGNIVFSVNNPWTEMIETNIKFVKIYKVIFRKIKFNQG